MTVVSQEIGRVEKEIRETRNDKNKFKAKLTRSILEGSKEGKALIGNIEKLMNNGTKSLEAKN